MGHVWAVLHHTHGEAEASILFPDLPGCISQAASMEDAQHMAAKALALWLGEKGVPLTGGLASAKRWLRAQRLPAGKVACFQVALPKSR